ncbi:hypothetical protein D3C75_870740 [compost metagenome]
MVERYAKGFNIGLHICVVTDYKSNIRIQISGLPLPEQFDQTVVLFGNKDCQSLLMAHIKNLPVHLKALGDTAEDGAHLIQPLIKIGQVELHSHEEHATVRVHRILV